MMRALMECPVCQQTETILWAHNGGVGTHHWGDKDERHCGCGPKMICSVCDSPLLAQHGFVVLDAACFAYSNDTLQ